MIATKFFEFYKSSSSIVKLLLFVFVPIMAILWIIGSLAHFDRLIMFIVGVIGGCVLIYIFYPQVSMFINELIKIIKEII